MAVSFFRSAMTHTEPIRLAAADSRRPLVIAGPCSAETEEQTLATARQLADEGVRIFRAGLWKPRTKPGGFEGVGSAGIAWLERVKRETGMYVATEIATPHHAEAVLESGIDLLWLGARTTANPFAVQEIADALSGRDIPVLVKNPVSPDLELWIGAVDRLRNAGIRRIGVIHRGFTSIDRSRYRNHPMWGIPIELRRRFPDGNIPQSFRDAFRRKSLPLMKYTNILSFNWRTIALFASLFLQMPWLYFAFELTVLNILLLYMVSRHESLCRDLTAELKEGKF